MKFSEARCLADMYRQAIGIRDASEIYAYVELKLAQYVRETQNVHQYANDMDHVRMDRAFVESRRPFFNVYPALARGMAKVDLDKVRVEQVQFPAGCSALEFRFATDNPPTRQADGYDLRAVILHRYVRDDNGEPVMVAGLDFGETLDGAPIMTVCRYDEQHGATVGDCRKAMAKCSSVPGVPLNDEAAAVALRICIGCLLLGTDADLVDRVVLNRDRGKVLTETMLQRAERNGRFGWEVGRDIECQPHWRNGCFALVWTGKGRSVPKIVWRRGTMVHRVEIPTGYASGVGSE